VQLKSIFKHSQLSKANILKPFADEDELEEVNLGWNIKK